jgi:hypothetical protein
MITTELRPGAVKCALSAFALTDPVLTGELEYATPLPICNFKWIAATPYDCWKP